MNSTFDTYCGLECASCKFLADGRCFGCVATGGKPFHGACAVADCARKRGVRFCGECKNMPCEILTRYSFDPKEGDNGARIENLRKIMRALADK